MPEFMIIGILLVLAIAWCVKDYRLRSEARRLQAKAEATKHIVDHGTKWVCTIPCGGRGRPHNRGEAWDMCVAQGKLLGIPQHWWRRADSSCPKWVAYKSGPRRQYWSRPCEVLMDELTLEYEGEGASEQEAFDEPWSGAGGVR